jgi:hypothetical protein
MSAAMDFRLTVATSGAPNASARHRRATTHAFQAATLSMGSVEFSAA